MTPKRVPSLNDPGSTKLGNFIDYERRSSRPSKNMIKAKPPAVEKPPQPAVAKELSVTTPAKPPARPFRAMVSTTPKSVAG